MDGRQKRTIATRAKLMTAAAEVFLKHGLRGASLSQIAKHAGVNQSLIGHHFGGKQGLWESTLEKLSEEYIDLQLSELAQGEGRGVDLLAEAIAAYFRYLKNNPDAVRLNSWLFLEGYTKPPERLVSLTQLGFIRLHQGQQMGHVRADLPVEFIWASFISLAGGWFQLRAQFADLLQEGAPNQDLDDAYLQTVIKIFLDGVKPR